jgi:pilus assembly protein CpaE
VRSTRPAAKPSIAAPEYAKRAIGAASLPRRFSQTLDSVRSGDIGKTMGAFITYAPGVDPEQLRQLILNVGLDCAVEDTVPLSQLDERLPQVIPDLVLVHFGQETEAGVEAVRRACQQAPCPVLAMGPSDDSQLVLRAMRAGAREYLDAADARNELDSALEKLAATDEDPRIRGDIISVYSPTSGSGTTTVASNLAGALGRQHPGDVALIELSRRDGDLSLFLDLDPAYTVEDACKRWDRLDATSLGSGLVEHESGISVLAHAPDEVSTDLMHPEAVRRIAVLLRSMFRYTVFDLDSDLAPEQLEVMKLSDAVVVVLRPDVPAVRRAQRVLGHATESGVRADRLRLVINRWGQSGQLPLRSITDLLELEPFQLIPDDPRRVNAAVNQGVMLHQLSRAAPITRRFVQLATQLNGQG